MLNIFAPAIENGEEILIPTITIYEVFKKFCVDLDVDAGEEAVFHMKQALVVDLSLEIALLAAKQSIHYKLPMADSIIYATAQLHSATLWTQDQHFDGLPGVQYIEKGKNP